MQIELFHTSPALIEKIKLTGTFDSYLFFSESVYVMTAVENFVTYSVTVNESEVINACDIDDETNDELAEVVARFMKHFDCDEETALDCICERSAVQDVCQDVDGEGIWYAQLLTAQAAKARGFDIVRVTDEQGTAYMIDCYKKEAMLVLQ